MSSLHKSLASLSYTSLSSLYALCSTHPASLKTELLKLLRQENTARPSEGHIAHAEVGALASNKLVSLFMRFYDTWFGMELTFFYLDYPEDTYSALKEFNRKHARGHFGCPLYLSDRSSRDGRLLSLLE